MLRAKRPTLRLVELLYSHTFQQASTTCATHTQNIPLSCSVLNTLKSGRLMASTANGTEHAQEFDLVTIGAGTSWFSALL